MSNYDGLKADGAVGAGLTVDGVMPADTERASGQKVKWYRSPVDKAVLNKLNAKSDLKGFAQAGGHLGLIVLTGFLSIYSAYHWPLWAIFVCLYLHGTTTSFAINAVHELVHKCVFRTQALNQFFARVFAWIGWINHEHFYQSHMRHHQYTLHQPDDLEVTLPIKIVVKNFIHSLIAYPPGIKWLIPNQVRLARGKFMGEWETKLFPEDHPERARPVIAWSRFILISHGLLLVVSLYMHWGMVPIVVSLTPLYGNALFFLCNNTQHIGLRDDVPDFRLCCRTFTCNPLVQFLYWHMNYHIEHHTYAAVPCYNLGKLHRAIKADLPPTPHGIIAVWKDIVTIQRHQATETEYEHSQLIPQATERPGAIVLPSEAPVLSQQAAAVATATA